LLHTFKLGYGQTYYWTVSAYYGSGNYSAAASGGKFTVAGTQGSITPILTYPIGGAIIYSQSPTLSWYVNGSTTGIVNYKVVYSTNSNMTPNTTVSPVSNQSYHVTGLLVPGATYYWKVAAYNGTAYSSYSSTGTFVVSTSANPKVVVPLAGSPIHGVGITESSVMISWVIPIKTSGSLTYKLQYSTNPDMSNAVTVAGIKNPYQIVNDLQTGKTYYWRVRSSNDNGLYSSYSGVGKFVKNAVTAVENNKTVIPTKFSVSQNYPNPFNPSTIIKYALPQASHVTIKIYNMLGQEVKMLVNSDRSAGTYQVQWNGESDFGRKVASGAYIYRVVAGNNIVTKKMILLK
ncbi:MAG TPA: T9SS type A sorting domain-containing protein, partial [Ignavibacteria bacterium]|nr:T9SS type A sorting domain-containing protein [Ignavibacteria bacterium]